MLIYSIKLTSVLILVEQLRVTLVHGVVLWQLPSTSLQVGHSLDMTLNLLALSTPLHLCLYLLKSYVVLRLLLLVGCNEGLSINFLRTGEVSLLRTSCLSPWVDLGAVLSKSALMLVSVRTEIHFGFSLSKFGLQLTGHASLCSHFPLHLLFSSPLHSFHDFIYSLDLLSGYGGLLLCIVLVDLGCKGVLLFVLFKFDIFRDFHLLLSIATLLNSWVEVDASVSMRYLLARGLNNICFRFKGAIFHALRILLLLKLFNLVFVTSGLEEDLDCVHIVS